MAFETPLAGSHVVERNRERLLYHVDPYVTECGPRSRVSSGSSTDVVSVQEGLPARVAVSISLITSVLSQSVCASILAVAVHSLCSFCVFSGE